MLKHKGKLKTITIQNILQPIWPKNKNISKHDIVNVRLRIKRLLPKIEKCDTFESFQKSINTSWLLVGLDDENMTDNEAYEMATTSVWKDLINNGGDDIKYRHFTHNKNLSQVKDPKNKIQEGFDNQLNANLD